MFGRIVRVIKEQPGFTLVELPVALAITGVIGISVLMAITQMIGTSTRNSNHTVATKQMQSAIHWVRLDAKMAQTVQVDAGASGLPLTLSWVEWDATQHVATYDVEGLRLKRSHSVNGGAPTVLYLADPVNADPALTSCSFTDGVLTFTITTVAGSGARATNMTEVFNVDPRASP